ncbi:MAG TPA: hypothetical protein PKA88_37800, partial [Polyangiaceae bacterium]|nr:hypothetical protein [Polyangiaceae bacterium]
MELDDSIYARVTDVCDIAEQRIEAGDYASAIRAYQDAYALLPDPREQWEAATWILTGIGDAYWYL